MKQNIPVGVGVVILIVVAILVVLFGWRKVSGGADADVTQETIDRYQNMSKQTFGGGGANAGANQATHGTPPAGAPAANPGKP